MNRTMRDRLPWVALVAAVAGLAVYRNPLLDPGGTPDAARSAAPAAPAHRFRPPAPPLPTTAPRPTADAPLPGGGTFIGSRCGTRGHHRFAPPAAPTPAPSGSGRRNPGGDPGGDPGPRLTLGSWGYGRDTGSDPGRFTVGLLLTPGRGGVLDLAAPLGPEGVAVEIEGPDGIVGGAYGLPVELSEDAERTPDGGLRVPPGRGATAMVTLPAAALCPGYDGFALQQVLIDPVDSSNTVTGEPPYRLTVSVSDPAVGALRRAAGSPVPGDVLSADNRLRTAAGPGPDEAAAAAV